MKTVIGIFADRDNASSAINSLKSEGYKPEDISIMMQDKREEAELGRDTGTNVAGGAATGATSGALLGGLAGLLASFVIPGLGAFFIGGPIATALGLTGAAATTASGAATGALAGGLLGALTGLGLSEDDAKVYEQRINSGGILVAVPARSGEEDEVENILSNHNADQIRSVRGIEKTDRFVNREVADTDTNMSGNLTDYPQTYPNVAVKGGKARQTSVREDIEDEELE